MREGGRVGEGVRVREGGRVRVGEGERVGEGIGCELNEIKVSRGIHTYYHTENKKLTVANSAW